MTLFTSNRERRLWLWALTVIVAIYATVGLAGRLAAVLNPIFVGWAFGIAFLAVIVAVIASALRRSGRREVWAALGLGAVYTMVIVRMGVGPLERSHLFEYGLLALLIYEALRERVRNGRPVPVPGLLSVIVTTLFGWLDEGIQAFLPNRVYDLRDVAVNALAGLMAVLASAILAWARRSYTSRAPRAGGVER